jgi:hypothetical protein
MVILKTFSGILEVLREKMENNKYNVVSVKGAVPEKFMLVWLDPAALPNEGFIQTGKGMSEAEMQEELEKMQIAKRDIDGLIENARKDPK